MIQRLATIALTLSLVACAQEPARRMPPAHVAPPPPVSTQVYFYPTAGQSPQRQARDRYECYLWAVKASGFDPSRSSLAPAQRVVVEPRRPAGTDTAVGAVTGAAVGAAVSRPRDAGEGAIVGAVAGAVLGAASDASRVAEARELQNRYDQRDAARSSRLDQRASTYRRAMSACLEGRGYTVE